ncbi:synaptonemal complex central element protein 3 [Sparus aurata]|uniref:Synaptonemal complex central element protein 3 n=1 Tax=Sparus aurata TaxID=8175 RepID=A0A671Z1Z7_SPAAU|nr:synaptonemal complex central element protein 3 [Sparus aurata]XP_030253229.1 synaptonemal complex central element protein 3 [Sparus aurata]
MADSSSSGFIQLPQISNNDVWELIKDLERMIEHVENISLQLTCMAYDLVALRTSPELGVSMRNLEEAYHQCRAAVCGDQELEMDDCPDPTATPTPPQM